MNDLVSWLKELAVFIVICETILSFTPNAVYKRYIKPFVGLIMLLRITSFLFGAVEIDWNQRINEIFTDYEQSVNCYLENASIVKQEDAVTERLNEVTQEYGAEHPGDIEKMLEMEENIILNEDITIIEDIVISPIKIGEIE